MCGLAGLLLPTALPSDELISRVRRLIDPLAHRGPDDQGTWCDPSAGIGLGFRRLAIIDLSSAGHQPMASASGRYTAVFNGEIYNHRALRGQLEKPGVQYRGHSDTEVMLAGFEAWGIRATLPRLVGMFAVAVWDAQERALTLIRDRLGKKPLYYHGGPHGVLFGSELKALCADPSFPRRLDLDSLALYFRYLYVPSPKSIYADTYKLPPGHSLTVRAGDLALPRPEPYWRVSDCLSRSRPPARDDRTLTDECEALLRDAVRLRLEADVPLGALLSGGVDSSTVVALMQEAVSTPVRTFTIGFDVAAHDESSQAAAVASHLGTRHTALRVTGDDALKLVPALPRYFDEPLADPSGIPTFLVSRLARQDVTVALTGDGGDEVFGGYNRYLQGARIIRAASALPRPVRLLAAGMMQGIPATTLDTLYRWYSQIVPAGTRHRLVGDKWYKIAALLREPSPALQYRSLLSAWQAPQQLLRAPVSDDGAALEALFAADPSMALAEQMMLFDQGHYLPDDLLAKVDRASMAVSLEARTPLLDHRIVEFGWGLPLSSKLGQGQGKRLLRQVLYRHVPRDLVDRPKVGFSVPIAEWLRGPLLAWAEDLLHGEGPGGDEVLNTEAVRLEWEEFKAGRRPIALPMWTVLQFLDWRREWGASV